MEIVTQITSVFTAVGDWIGDAMTALLDVFWNSTDNKLTILGTLTTMGLAISVILLLLNIIQNFLKFRG